MLQAIASVLSQRTRATGSRSPQWSALRRRHIASNPRCAACGRSESVEAHHLVPVQVDKSRELDPSNLITLCGGSRNCHLVVGHGWNWRTYRPDAATLAEAMLKAAVIAPEKEASKNEHIQPTTGTT
jgi:hypothetical protein